ncbi:vacuolar sorting-associated 13c [Brachionus plicatilis]|uniref:Vacuolar sorting-associated 13c n=1 Tax=Brachionus plicatilis TaxID=10195 RepID=A0A3M7SVW0_BRAPC|nr:vacuolar sorting-associated 13c [Brachionus plicatilis]
MFDNDQCHSLTGLKSDQFCILLQSIDGDWPYSISKRDTLFMFLARLRLGLSIAKILYLFQFKKTQYKAVTRLISFIRERLIKNFVPKNFGLTHLSRGEIQIKYTSELSKKLLQVKEENIITVWDATYELRFVESENSALVSKKLCQAKSYVLEHPTVDDTVLKLFKIHGLIRRIQLETGTVRANQEPELLVVALIWKACYDASKLPEGTTIIDNNE